MEMPPASPPSPAAGRSTTVTLVIPAWNAGRTLGACLESVSALLSHGLLQEVIVVDDHSSDSTAQIAAGYPVRLIRSAGRGAGAARNTGWKQARTELVWFIDSDCVAEPDALQVLTAHFSDPAVCAAGGSYGIAEESLVARLIHEEIIERHLNMPPRVSFLASFNLLCRRDMLERVGGFNPALALAQDGELAYRMREAGGELAFDVRSKVKHFHPTKLFAYLRKQAQQGYWRVQLYLLHPEKMKGDSYSGPADHLQPPLAMFLAALGPLALWNPPRALLAALCALFCVLPLPMTLRLMRRCGPLYLLYLPLALLRAFFRGWGMSWAVLHRLCGRRESGPGRHCTGQDIRSRDVEGPV